MRLILTGVVLASAFSFGLIGAASAQGLILDNKLTLSPIRGATVAFEQPELTALEGHYFLPNTELTAESPSPSINQASYEMNNALTLSTPALTNLSNNQKIKPLGFNPKVMSMSISSEASLSFSQSEIGDNLASQSMQGIHLVSRIDHGRSVYFGVETLDSNVESSRANLGILFSLD